MCFNNIWQNMANKLFRQRFSVQTWLRKGWDALLNIVKTEAVNALVMLIDQKGC